MDGFETIKRLMKYFKSNSKKQMTLVYALTADVSQFNLDKICKNSFDGVFESIGVTEVSRIMREI